MINSLISSSPANRYDVFRAGSKTYFYSSIFFPRHIRDLVAILYRFVRVADNFVDSSPQDAEGFHLFRGNFTSAWNGILTGNPTIDDFVLLAKNKGFELAWIESFLDAMEQDLTVTRYHSLSDTIKYMYGSAEVIGLMMSRLFQVPDIALPYAQLLGRSMQYINFIRDIDEDLQLGRIYLPQEEITECGLTTLSKTSANKHPEEFGIFIRRQISQYLAWHEESIEGFFYLPTSSIRAVATATAMYKWTANQIAKNPLIVFSKKVKPSKSHIIMWGLFSGKKNSP
jgi:phytoene synthase